MAGQPDSALDQRVEPDLLTAFAALQSLLLDSPNLAGFLGDVARLAAGVVPCASCGITVRRDGQPLTVASSDKWAEQVDEVQYGAGEGPCLDTLHTGAVIDVPDLAADGRWDGYRQHALEHGVRSSVSIPLAVGSATVGALNLAAGSIMNYELATPDVVGAGVNDLVNVLGDLTLAGTLNVPMTRSSWRSTCA